jgi:NADP-dependent 3-hydroxy acid dehydrogenase YdfG
MVKNSYKTHDLKNRSVLITGASSGIGKAIASALSEQGACLKLVARREDRLKDLKAQLGGDIEYIVGDITETSTLKVMKQAGFFDVDICINNAGLASGLSHYYNSLEDDINMMLDLNIKAVFQITRKCLPYLKQHGGDILNISSVAGHESYANGAVYCATKHAIKAFSQALRKETYGEDIRVMMLSPGMVETEFSIVRFKGDKDKADKVYQGLRPLTPEDMAQHVLYMLTRPRHVNIDDLLCLSTDQASATIAKRRSN